MRNWRDHQPRPMRDPTLTIGTVLSALVIFGTGYSVLYNTYLDTSNPLLSSLPHPLSKTHYFANKANFLNVYFIKKAWGWTSALFFLSWVTSPSQTRTQKRVVRWLLATSVWVMFTMWFFGPSLLDRAIVASGGTCTVYLPSGDLVDVPVEACFMGTAVGPSSHPHLFAQISNAGFSSSSNWTVRPRLRRGHDVSGHIFLLTLSALFLTNQLRSSFRLPSWSIHHRVAVYANMLLIGTWLLAIYTTSVYFHSPHEKLTGYREYSPVLFLGLLSLLINILLAVLGVGSYWLTQVAIWG